MKCAHLFFSPLVYLTRVSFSDFFLAFVVLFSLLSSMEFQIFAGVKHWTDEVLVSVATVLIGFSVGCFIWHKEL